MNYIIIIKQSSVKLSWKMYMNVMIVCLKLHGLDDMMMMMMKKHL